MANRADGVRQLSFAKRLGIRAAAVLFRLLICTLRVRFTPRMGEFLNSQPTSNLILLWHNRLSLALAGFASAGKRIPLTGLVSASGDGAILAEVMHAFGIETARGSSSRRAVQATRELLAVLEAGRNVVITPDGPRGPIYTVKQGTVGIGQSHARAVVLLGFTCSSCWHIKSSGQVHVSQAVFHGPDRLGKSRHHPRAQSRTAPGKIDAVELHLSGLRWINRRWYRRRLCLELCSGVG